MNNQIKRNLIAKEKIEESGTKLRDIKSSVLASLFNTYEGACTNCGGYVSEPNLSFFGFDVSRVKCMNCQWSLDNLEKTLANLKLKEEEKMRDDNYPPTSENYSKKENKEILFEYNLK